MNAESLSKKLNGCEYKNEVNTEIINEAKENDLVIVFGLSDFFIELRGAINDEIDFYDGDSIFVTENGLVETNTCFNAREIQAVWRPRKKGYTYANWLIKTTIPHHSFDIMKDGKLYCRGIVFSLKDCRIKN